MNIKKSPACMAAEEYERQNPNRERNGTELYNAFMAGVAWQRRAALQSQDAEDAERYRWLREHGFNHADVELTSDLDGNPITIWRLRFYIPEPSGLPYEEDEWTLEQLDAAIDHARRAEGDVE